jgi:hypothetical protein
VRDILWKRSRPDYDRFIFIHDKVSTFRHTLATRFLQVIHYDLRDLFKKKQTLGQKISNLNPEDGLVDNTLKNLHITK